MDVHKADYCDWEDACIVIISSGVIIFNKRKYFHNKFSILAHKLEWRIGIVFYL